MTDFKEMRAAALLAQSAAEKYANGEINPTEFVRQCSEFNSLTDSPEQILALLDELEGATAHVALLKIDRRELVKEAEVKDKWIGMARRLLAMMKQEPVAHSGEAREDELIWNVPKNQRGYGVALYAEPQPATIIPEEMTPLLASRSYGGEVRRYLDGWNACLAAMLHNQPISTVSTESLCGIKPAPALDSSPKIADSRCSNYPGIPDGWIKCSERMPEEYETILVHQEGGVIFCAEYEDGEFHPDEFPNVPKQGYEITHWMSLPAVPKQETL
ncbi:DUF551 domain-containing protein [Pluralibacter gergoviae]